METQKAKISLADDLAAAQKMVAQAHERVADVTALLKQHYRPQLSAALQNWLVVTAVEPVSAYKAHLARQQARKLEIAEGRAEPDPRPISTAGATVVDQFAAQIGGGSALRHPASAQGPSWRRGASQRQTLKKPLV